jgi:hypothetical protein
MLTLSVYRLTEIYATVLHIQNAVRLKSFNKLSYKFESSLPTSKTTYF